MQEFNFIIFFFPPNICVSVFPSIFEWWEAFPLRLLFHHCLDVVFLSDSLYFDLGHRLRFLYSSLSIKLCKSLKNSKLWPFSHPSTSTTVSLWLVTLSSYNDRNDSLLSDHSIFPCCVNTTLSAAKESIIWIFTSISNVSDWWSVIWLSVSCWIYCTGAFRKVLQSFPFVITMFKGNFHTFIWQECSIHILCLVSL